MSGEVVTGPPIPGAPWTTLAPQSVTKQQGGFGSTNLRLTQEVVRILVAPTDAKLRLTQLVVRVLAQNPPPPTFAPEIKVGPMLLGAPWVQPFVEPHTTNSPNLAPPPPPPPPVAVPAEFLQRRIFVYYTYDERDGIKIAEF